MNQNGSVLSIDAQAERRIEGRFLSRKGRAALGIAYPVHGTVNGELVSFTVNFSSDEADLCSITSFSGRYERTADGRERVHTVWILARQFEDDARTKRTQPWNTFLTNSDVFEKDARPG